jgi:PhzF family phenazine biosynthesis protein
VKLTVIQIDAFARKVFEGNPAAVVPLDVPLPDLTMQAIAGEHNLSETAFIWRDGAPGRWGLRWFTPTTEVDLCGHATLAAGAVVLRDLEPALSNVAFQTKSGEIVVKRSGDGFMITLDATPPAAWNPGVAADVLGLGVVDAMRGSYAHIVVDDPEALRALGASDGVAAASMVAGDTVRHRRHLGVTAAGDGDVDVVLRFFAPGVGILEDPVTGSALCDLAPYWTEKLGKPELLVHQASSRGGYLTCRYDGGGSVKIAGGAVEYSRAQIRI